MQRAKGTQIKLSMDVGQLQGVTPAGEVFGSEEWKELWATLCGPLDAALDTRGGQFVVDTVQLAAIFAVSQVALMVLVDPAMGGRGDLASVSYVAANLFKGVVLFVMAAQRQTWDMMVGLVSGRGAPDEGVVLMSAAVYAALDLSALFVNGAMRVRTVLHHVFVVVVATCIAQLGADAPVSQAATLYAFWSGTAASVNIIMAASKSAQVRGTKLRSVVFTMGLWIYVAAFACNMASLALVVFRAATAGALPLHHAIPGAAIVCVWAYDDLALMRWLAKMSASSPAGPSEVEGEPDVGHVEDKDESDSE